MSDKITSTAFALVFTRNSRGELTSSLFEPGEYIATKKGEPPYALVVAIEPTPGHIMPPLAELHRIHKGRVPPVVADD